MYGCFVGDEHASTASRQCRLFASQKEISLSGNEAARFNPARRKILIETNTTLGKADQRAFDALLMLKQYTCWQLKRAAMKRGQKKRAHSLASLPT